jgi:hypothetical protein
MSFILQEHLEIHGAERKPFVYIDPVPLNPFLKIVPTDLNFLPFLFEGKGAF